MARILELRCMAHGAYEHHEKTCPAGCPPEFVTQEFRTPVSIGTAKTKFVDGQLKGLAKDYRLPDIHNDKDGASVMQSLKTGQAKDYRPTFVPIPHAAPGWTRRGEKPMAQSAAPLLFGKGGENTLERVPLQPVKPQFVNPPNPQPDVFK